LKQHDVRCPPASRGKAPFKRIDVDLRAGDEFAGVNMPDTCSEGLDTSFVALGYGRTAGLGLVQGITELMA